MALEYDGHRIGAMQYNGVTIGEAMMDGQVVYQSVVKLTGTSGMTSRNQLRDAIAARGLDYRTVTHLPFKIDTSQATSLLDLFNGWTALVVAPEMTTLQVTDMGGLFRGCTALEYVGDLQTSNVTNAGFMFDHCPALTDGNVRLLGRHPNVSTTAIIANSGLTHEPWYSADGLTLIITATAPRQANLQMRWELTRRGLNYMTIEKLPFNIDTSEATNLSWMFGDFLALKEAPAMDTSNVTDMSAMFWSCNALTAIPDLNTSKVTVANNMFQNCVSLTDGNVRLLGKHPNVDTTGMLTNAALTYEPWYNADGSPLRYSTTWSGGAFTAIRNDWQNVVFIDITERSRTSGQWRVGWNAPSSSSCSVRVLVGSTVIASSGPTVFGLTSRVIQHVTIPETDLYPGDRLNFQLLTDGSTNARRSVYSTSIALS